MSETTSCGAFCIVPRDLIERVARAGLGACHLGLLTFLIDRADRRGISFWSFKKIGERLGCSKSTVSRMLSDLHREGFVDKKPRPRRDKANSVLEIQIAGYAEFLSSRAKRGEAKNPAEEAKNPAEAENLAETTAATVTCSDKETDKPVKPSTFAVLGVSQTKRAVSRTQHPVAEAGRHGNENQVNNTQEKNHSSSLPKREGTNVPLVPDWDQAKERDWVRYFGMKTGLHDRPSELPPMALLDAAIKHDRLKVRQEAAQVADRKSAWRQMLRSVGVTLPAEHANELAKATSLLNEAALSAFLEGYKRDWQAHWRRPPTIEQVKDRVAGIKYSPTDRDLWATRNEIRTRAMVASHIKTELAMAEGHRAEKEIA